jgi:hypothetical protein
METHGFNRYRIVPFWDDSYKDLPYIQKPFNDQTSVDKWMNMGFQPKITGDLADMSGRQPSWNDKIIQYFTNLGWKDIGTAYYRMTSGTVMPTHQDKYVTYIDKFYLGGNEKSIRRAIIFLEDWKPGHYFDIIGEPILKWNAGDVVEWNYDTPHTAANIGYEDRYTLQVTGHK